MDREHDCMRLLVVILNLLDESPRHRITRYLDSHELDRALNTLLKEERLLPEWFRDGFRYDPLYGRLGGLRELLSTAAANGFLRMDGTWFDYHADLSEYVVSYLLSEIPFDLSNARLVARRLNHLLVTKSP